MPPAASLAVPEVRAVLRVQHAVLELTLRPAGSSAPSCPQLADTGCRSHVWTLGEDWASPGSMFPQRLPSPPHPSSPFGLPYSSPIFLLQSLPRD